MNSVLIISGSSGFIGRYLLEELKRRDLDYKIFSFGRWNKDVQQKLLIFAENHKTYSWNIIHLAGANIFAHPWTKSYKKILWESRIGTVKKIHQTLDTLQVIPEKIIGISAIGYYGDKEQIADEFTPSGNDFLSRLCVDWENAYIEASKPGTSLSILRLGVVMGQSGGAMQKMIGPFGSGLMFLPGGGNFPLNWISLHDVIRVILDLLNGSLPSGIYNLVNNANDTYRTFVEKIKTKNNIWLPSFSIPLFVLKIILGKRLNAVVSRTKVVPKVLNQQNFDFNENIFC